jgi:hypothetical protein
LLPLFFFLIQKIFPNGGNNTGEIGYHLAVDRTSSGATLQDLITRARPLVYAKLPHNASAPMHLFDRFGRELSDTATMENGSVYFLVPDGHHFFWPGMYVGYRVPLYDVPSANGSTLWMETLALRPRLFLIRNFLSAAEADFIVERSLPKLAKSRVVEDDGDKDHPSRTSSSTWLWKSEGETIKLIDRRSGALNKVPPTMRLEEAMQVVYYLPGQFYKSHNDWFDPQVHVHNEAVQEGVNRCV